MSKQDERNMSIKKKKNISYEVIFKNTTPISTYKQFANLLTLLNRVAE